MRGSNGLILCCLCYLLFKCISTVGTLPATTKSWLRDFIEGVVGALVEQGLAIAGLEGG
jgi:hypothetical protein